MDAPDSGPLGDVIVLESFDRLQLSHPLVSRDELELVHLDRDSADLQSVSLLKLETQVHVRARPFEIFKQLTLVEGRVG